MARKLSEAEIGRLRELAETLRRWQPDFSAERFSGRGIVIAAGGATVFTNAYVLVSVLRDTLNCALPIEVWHLGAAEMSPSMAALLGELGATVVDAGPLVAETGASVRDGWQLKPFAMLHSRFAEVLLLDADQVPIRDPAICFEWPEYVATGAVFWPDVVDLVERNPVWAALGLRARQEKSVESGQVLVDKRKCLRALAITVRLNEAAELLYELIYGDKDTFLLGWELAGQPFAMVPHRPFRDERILVQRSFAGEPLFQHRTNAKWRYDGGQYAIENFVHEEACLGALERLRRRWSGRVFHLPDRTAAARRAETALAARKDFSLEIDQDEKIVLELRPFGEIGEGRAIDRENWWCEEGPSGLVLRLGRPEGITYTFENRGGDWWSGRRLRPPEVPAQLIPIAEPAIDPAPTPGLADELVRAARLGEPHADETALSSALVLLARVEPGVLQRVRQLAPALPAAARMSLERIIGDLDAADLASRRADVRPDAGVLSAGYTRDIDDAGA